MFVFLASLDLTYLAKADAAVPRINPDFAPVYNSLFVCSLIFSLIMLCYAAIVQGQIHRFLHHQVKYYPLGRVTLSWVFAIAMINFHMFILVGGQNR